jgi:predicted secreted protein
MLQYIRFCIARTARQHNSSDVNKDWTPKAKAKAKDWAIKAKAKAKDLAIKVKAKAKDLAKMSWSRNRSIDLHRHV